MIFNSGDHFIKFNASFHSLEVNISCDTLGKSNVLVCYFADICELE